MSPSLEPEGDAGPRNRACRLALNDETISGVMDDEEKRSVEPFSWGLRV